MTHIGGLHGAALVARGGKILLEAAEGPADADGRTACTPDTRFQVASVSKQFAAAAALLLAEEGALAPSDPVGKWLEGWPDQWSGITLHHLLTHTGGVAHWGDVFPSGLENLPPLPEVLAVIAEAPLLGGPPPCPFRYSSLGYVVAAEVLQRAAGLPYGRLVAERIFRPLGMTATSAGPKPDGTVADGLRDGARTETVTDLSAMPGAGDIWSTVGDLARYTEALRDGRLLGHASLREMYTSHTSVGDGVGDEATVRGETYGYGTFLGTVAGHRARFHTGDNPGYRSFHGWLPDLDLTVVVLSNEEHGEAETDTIAARLVGAALEGWDADAKLPPG